MAGIGHRGFMGRKKEPVGLPFIFSVTVGNGESFQLPTVNGGTYDCLIEWGDTTSNTLTVWNDSGRSHTYAVGGTYDIRITGTFDGWKVGNYADRLKIVEVKQWGILLFGVGNEIFRGCSNLIITATDSIDTSACTSLYTAFQNTSILTDIPNVGDWDVSNVTNFEYIFSGSAFNASLNDWVASSVTSMYRSFYNSSFNHDVSDWDVSNVTNTAEMFRNSPFNQDVSLWDVSKVTRMDGMFWNTPFNQDVNAWNVGNVTRTDSMFRQSSFNKPLNSWDVKKVSNMNYMFHTSSFNQPIGAWATLNLTSILGMLSNTPFDQDISGWDVTELITATSFMSGVATALSTSNYDSLLISWGNQLVNNNVEINFGNSKYTSGGAAEAARTTLTSTYGWAITDGGAA